MNHDISQPVPQGSDGAQDAENSRIAAIADQLERLCKVHEAQCGNSLQNVSRFETEQRAAEQMAKNQGFWIPMMDVFNLGVPGPSGNENDTYVGEKVIYKVNNLLNSGSIVGLLRKILMHNILFPDTAYSFYGFKFALPILFVFSFSNTKFVINFQILLSYIYLNVSYLILLYRNFHNKTYLGNY